MRAAIYARFSSELQDARSITDQVAQARKYLETRGMQASGIYEDAGISGASVINRPGLQRLLADAAAEKFYVLVTESLDRLSRSQADIAYLYERLCFLGIRVETLADGHVSEIHVGLKGTMSALFLKDLAQKTRRGQVGRVKAGRIPGGRSYGYDVVPSGDDRGRRLINEREAAIVRRIFAEYTADKGSLAIVKDLNREGEPGPSGGKWNVSALVGSPKRRNGLLNNELYRGTIVYNRQRFVKDPATGKRVSRTNAESEWQRQDVPELRIVDEDVWLRAQQIRASRGGPRLHERRRPQRLLSGLIYCGCCGAKYNVATRDYMRCSARTNSGTCDESRLIKMSEVEARVLASLERHLLAPEVIAEALVAYRQEMERSKGQHDGARGRMETELADVERKLSRLLRMVEDGHADPAVAGPRMNELAQQKRELGSRLSVRPDDAAVPMITDAGAGYRKLVSELRVELGEGKDGTADATALVRGMLHRIVVSPRTGTKDQLIEVDAGFAPIRSPADRYCNDGCGGVQPVNNVVHVLIVRPSAPCFVVPQSRDLAFAA